jgi:hypothetical protein
MNNPLRTLSTGSPKIIVEPAILCISGHNARRVEEACDELPGRAAF